MKQREIELLAVGVLTYLSQLSDGTELSTCEAVRQVYETTAQEPYRNTIDFDDWFTLNELVWKKAGKYGLKLDDSKYAGLTVGLPHHIPYVVTHKKPSP